MNSAWRCQECKNCVWIEKTGQKDQDSGICGKEMKYEKHIDNINAKRKCRDYVSKNEDQKAEDTEPPPILDYVGLRFPWGKRFWTDDESP